MGVQASTNKAATGKLVFEHRKKANKADKVRIDILAFEVSSAMTKCVQLWYSLTEQEIRRLTEEVIRSEGVVNLVSSNETVLLSLACMEKLQDLTALAFAVGRLGRRCHEPALVGFEHIYNDILKHNIDVSDLEYSQKEMESKVKKMERYINSTSSLYQELEVLSEIEQALKRLQEENDPAQKENIDALTQKAAWQKQEIKYLKEISLWSRTYDKVIGLLARSVCTIYGRIIRVFGFPVIGWPQILSMSKNGDVDCSLSVTSNHSIGSQLKLEHSNSRLNGDTYTSHHSEPTIILPATELFGHPTRLSSGTSPILSRSISTSVLANANRANSPTNDSFMSTFCFSPGRQFHQQRSSSVSHLPRAGGESPDSSNTDVTFNDMSGFLSRAANSKGGNKLLFDPKTRLTDAPPSTLGGSALALHYANVVIIAEKMARYPHLITQDARDDLYQMLPNNVRMLLRSKLKSCMRGCSSLGCQCARAAEWKDLLEKLLGWLSPLAHNMIRWQSEHNFEQQQVVQRSNVLLLQTLYFADRVKSETAITELLVGLNYLWRYERDFKANLFMEYASNKEIDEYLEWQI